MSAFEICILVEGALIFLALGNIGETLDRWHKDWQYKNDMDDDVDDYEVG